MKINGGRGKSMGMRVANYWVTDAIKIWSKGKKETIDQDQYLFEGLAIQII